MHIYPGCVSSVTVMPGIHFLQGILPPGGEESMKPGKTDPHGHTPHQHHPRLVTETLTRNTGASRKSGITYKHASKWRAKSYSHLGRRAHLKTRKHCTKGLKIRLQFSMHSGGFSFLKYITRQSGQAKHYFFFFPSVFTALIYTLSDDLKIEFLGTKGTTQSYAAAANTYSQWDQK